MLAALPQGMFSGLPAITHNKTQPPVPNTVLQMCAHQHKLEERTELTILSPGDDTLLLLTQPKTYPHLEVKGPFTTNAAKPGLLHSVLLNPSSYLSVFHFTSLIPTQFTEIFFNLASTINWV